jgi:hypothetical protein
MGKKGSWMGGTSIFGKITMEASILEQHVGDRRAISRARFRGRLKGQGQGWIIQPHMSNG